MVETGVDWGMSGRRDSYSAVLCDPRTLATVGEIEINPEGTDLTWQYASDNYVQATVKVEKGERPEVGGRRMLVGIDWTVSIPAAGYASTRRLATMFVTDESARTLRGRIQRDLSCYGALYALNADSLSADYARYTGQSVFDELRELVEGGGMQLVADDTVSTIGLTHTHNVLHPLGSNRGERAVEVAAWMGCVLGCTPQGQVELSRVRDDPSQPVSYEFVVGSNCTCTEGDDLSRDDAPINRVVAYYSREQKPRDDDGFPLTDCVVVDLQEGAEYSYTRRGWRSTYVMQVSDPCSHAELERQAQLYLDQHCGSDWTVQIEHVGIPGLRVGDYVRYQNYRDHTYDLDVKCIVTEISTSSLTPVMMCKTKMAMLGDYKYLGG